MMRIHLAALLAVLLTQSPAEAAISYDGFDYAVGGALAGNTDWTPLNTGTAPSIVSGNLLIDGLPAPTGQKVQFAAGNIQEALGSLGSFSAESVYFSLAVQLTAVPTTATYSLALATGNTLYGSAVWIQADGGGGFNVGLSNRSNSTPTYSLTNLSLNTTYFLVGSYTFNGGTGDDSSSLWLNPAPATFGLAAPPSPSLTVTGGTDMAAITQFLLRGAAGSPSGEIDELRVGSTWASVTPVPEPSAALGILGGIGILSIVRRHRVSRR